MKAFLPLLFLLSSYAMSQQLIIEDNVKFLALGDSYTIGESVPVNQRWPVQLIDSLSARGLEIVESKIIATTGWRTDNLKDAIQRAKLTPTYTLVSLLIGVNNYYQGRSVEDYAIEFEELLTTSIALAGGIKSRVFVLSIPDYGFTPFGKNNQSTITKGIDAFNAVNESIAKQLGVTYYNITDISRKGLDEPNLIAFDGLHPSGEMYTKWVDVVLKDATLKHSPNTGGDDEEDDIGQEQDVTGTVDEESGIRIYPNPFRNFIHLKNLPPSAYTLQLMTADGRVALNVSEETKSSWKVDTRSLSSGNYILTLTLKSNGKIMVTQKLIKM